MRAFRRHSAISGTAEGRVAERALSAIPPYEPVKKWGSPRGDAKLLLAFPAKRDLFLHKRRPIKQSQDLTKRSRVRAAEQWTRLSPRNRISGEGRDSFANSMQLFVLDRLIEFEPAAAAMAQPIP